MSPKRNAFDAATSFSTPGTVKPCDEIPLPLPQLVLSVSSAAFDELFTELLLAPLPLDGRGAGDGFGIGLGAVEKGTKVSCEVTVTTSRFSDELTQYLLGLCVC